MKKVLKILGISLMVLAIVLTQIPASRLQASGSASDGLLMDKTTLVKYTGTATSVSVPSGVKTIQAEAFADCTSLSGVTFPSSLEKIENSAFSGCENIRRIIIPEGCTSIGNGAFADCKNLSAVTLPASLTELGSGVFAGCEDLKTVNITKGNNSFICEDGVIYSADKTRLAAVLAGRDKTSYSMPNTVEAVDKYAFWGCDNLATVSLSNRLSEIGDYTFSNAAGLTSVNIPFSVRSIGIKAFEDCRKLGDVNVPLSVGSIADSAFDGCRSLNIIAEENSTAAKFFETFEANQAAQMEYEDSLSGNKLVDSDEKDNNSTDSESQNSTDKYYASDVDNYVEWDVDSPGVLGRTKVVSRQAVVLMDANAGTVYNGEQSGSVSQNGDETLVTPDKLQQSIIRNGTTVAHKAFYQNQALLSFSIPSGVNRIDDFAFARSGLTGIDIPSGVTEIGYGAFYHCDNLSSVSVPATVTEIEPEAFSYTRWLNDWEQSGDVDDFLVVGDGILIAYKGNGNQVTIPSNVRQIGAEVFKDHTELEQVSLSDELSVIGEDAFSGCSNLSNISGGSNLTEIRDRAFYGCPLETVRIPATVSRLGLKAFGGNETIDSAIFLGNTLPQLSYEKTATRLTNESFRGDCLDGIPIAVINSADVALSGTVLDASVPGFSGAVVVVDDESAGTAHTVQVSNTAGAENIPKEFSLYNKIYSLTTDDGALENAASSNSSLSENTIDTLKKVTISNIDSSQVSVQMSGSTVDTDGYLFNMTQEEKDGTQLLKSTVEKEYGFVDDNNYYAMELSMNDPTDTIPISRLGRDMLTVTMPVPAELLDDEVCVVSLDERDSLEITFCNYLERDGQTCISFEVNHFSPYALYGADGELKDRITQKKSNASGAALLDSSPDTGERVDIRILLFVGVFALGLFLLMAGCTRKKMIKK